MPNSFNWRDIFCRTGMDAESGYGARLGGVMIKHCREAHTVVQL